MTGIFSSAEATAVANLLVFLGVMLAVIRIGRTWWSRLTSRYFARSRRIQQKQILDELLRIRKYRTNKLSAVRDTAYGLFNDFIASFIMIIAIIAVFVSYIAIDSNIKEFGSEMATWQPIHTRHTYWFSIIAGIFIPISIMAVILVIGMKEELRYLDYAAAPGESQRKLVMRYLRLRSYR